MEEYMDDLSPKVERSKGTRQRKVHRGPLPPWESPGISLRPDIPKIDYNRRPPPLEMCEEDLPPALRDIFFGPKKSGKDEEESDDPNSKDLFASKSTEESTVVKASSSGAPMFKESDSNSDLESPGPARTSTQMTRGIKKRQSVASSNSETLSTMSSVIYPDVDASKLGYSNTTRSFGSPTRGHSTVLMPKPVLGIPKFNESEEQEYVSSDEEAPPADQIFQQTSINRLSRPPNRDLTVYTPPSTLCVTTDYETSDADEETRAPSQSSSQKASQRASHRASQRASKSASQSASQRASQRASQKSSQFDQTWDDEDGFEEALQDIDGMNTSAISVQTDITDGKITQKESQDDDEWEDDGLDDYFNSVCNDLEKTKAVKTPTPAQAIPSTSKSTFERLQERREAEKRKRSDPDLDSRKRTKSESADANLKPQQTGINKIQKTSNITKQTAKPISKPEQKVKIETASTPANTEDDFSDDDLFDELVEEIDKAQTQNAAAKKK